MKRFTETGKWRDPWFRRLSKPAKFLWLYLLDTCDVCGVLELDLELASFDTGVEITEQHVAELGDRLQRLDSRKVIIPKFVSFQFGVETLNPLNRAHLGVIRALRGHQLSTKKYLKKLNHEQGASKPLASPLLAPSKGLTDTDTDTDTDKDKRDSKREKITLEAIYAAYPRKVGKPAALRAIKRVIVQFGAEFIYEKTVAYAATQPANDRFTPHPSTWFNQHRFADDPATWRVEEKKKGPPKPWEVEQKRRTKFNDLYPT